MSHNRALHKQLRSTRAHFYPADLHFHSPASADNRRPPRFDQLSQEIQDKLSTIPEATATNPVEYEKQVMKAFPPESFYKSLIERRDTVIAGTEAEDASCD